MADIFSQGVLPRLIGGAPHWGHWVSLQIVTGTLPPRTLETNKQTNMNDLLEVISSHILRWLIFLVKGCCQD